MVSPIAVHVDHEADTYEIAYRTLPDGAFICRDEQIAPGVSAGIAPDGAVVGIELLGLEPAKFAAALSYAAARGLTFPRDADDLTVAP